MVWRNVDEYCTARNVSMAELSGARVKGRPRLGWMDNVKVLLGTYLDINWSGFEAEKTAPWPSRGLQ